MTRLDASKCCQVCGYPIYVLWIDGEPPGTCIEGKKDPMECGEAIRRRDTELSFLELRRRGEVL